MASKRTVLRTGFGTVIGLSVVSTLLAYMIQDSFSKRTVDIHRRYVQEQTVLNRLRRVLWTGGIIARDFFLNTAADRQETYLSQVSQLRTEGETCFRDLARIRPRDQASVKLKQKVDDLLGVLAESASAAIPDSGEYSFVQEQIVPRRDAAGRLLRELEKANESALTQSEEEFTSVRRAAAQGLVAMLAIELLLAILISRISLRYSENLESQRAAQLEEVSLAKAELEKLSARLMEIQEEERTRLSRELHDEIVQTLAVLRIEVTQAQQLNADQLPQIRDHLDRMRGLAERTLQTVRNITLLLRPSLLDDLGLGPALQWLTEDFRRRTKVRCEYTEEGLEDDLPEALKTCVYRVTQEALHNCEKHAHALNVRVHVVQKAGTVVLEVSDDGVGIEGKTHHNSMAVSHFGILGMRERAANLGGTLSLDGAPGAGLKVTLTVPVRGVPSDAQSNRAEALA